MIQAATNNQILKPDFSVSPGDGTGNALADARARNRQGRCAMQGCGKPMDPSIPPRGNLGCMCRECDDQFEAELQGLDW